MLRVVLILLAGVLLGANAVYFLMTRDAAQPAEAIVLERAPAPDRAAPGVTEDTTPGPPTAPGRSARSTTPPPPAPLPPGPHSPGPGGLIVPVQGIASSQLSDTFDDTRGSDRMHEALDIMASRGTPVLAVADGTVEKLFDSKQGGLTLYQFEPSGKYAYYYAHMDRYAAGVVEGKPLRQGEVIGYVGSTGNANPDGPHLHFAVFALGPERQWWKGSAINPYPLLRAR